MYVQAIALLISAAISMALLKDCCRDAGGTGTDQQGDAKPAAQRLDWGLESSPLLDEVEAYLAANPANRFRHTGWCGTPMAMAHMEFKAIIQGGSAEEIIPLLNHTAPYLRGAVHERLGEMGADAMPAINEAFENGSARIKLELLKYVEPEASDERVHSLLDEIIHDDNLKVFFEDESLIKWNVCGTGPRHLSDYPVDIFRYYMRLMTESDFATDRGIAAMDLGSFGEEAVGAVPSLIELLESEDEYIQTWWGFGKVGYSSESLRGAAAVALGDIGPSGSDAIPHLAEALDDPNIEVRCCAASSLYLVGHNKDEMIGFLNDLLNDDSASYALPVVARHLGRIGPDASRALPRLHELMRSEDHWTRSAAINAIVVIEGNEDSEIRLYMGNLKDPNPVVREDAVNGLRRFIRESDEVVSALYEMLNDENADVKWAACSILLSRGYGGPIGPSPERIFRAAVELLDGIPDTSHAYDVAFTIQSMDLDLPEAIPGLLKLMESENDAYMYTAGDAIIAVGGSRKVVAERLIELAGHENKEISNDAVRHLPTWGEDAIGALPILNGIIMSERSMGRGYEAASTAMALIRQVSPGNVHAVPSLSAILECGRCEVVSAASAKIIEITSDYDLLVRRLMELLEHESRFTRACAVQALGELGENAKDALPKLKDMAQNDGHRMVRSAAEEAIGRIE